MPLFYLRPFNFHADKEALRNPKPKLFEFDRGDILTITATAAGKPTACLFAFAAPV